jgi:hypothetical protein
MPAAALADTAAHDIEARIQYSYFTEDGRALDQLAATLAPEGADPTAGYLRGFAEYRRAQLRATTDGSGARQAGDACVRHADLATRADAKAAEPLVLHAACAALVAQVARVTAPLAGGNSLKRLGRAQRLQPRNPRVMFLAAQLERPRVLDRATRARSIERLRAALEAFEGERRQAVRVPSWGAADAYLALGQLLLESGDAVAAREAIERALLLAPEFAQARRVAARIGAGGE